MKAPHAAGVPAMVEWVAALERPELTGADGANRARERHNQLGAAHDLQAVQSWLAEYAGSPSTLRAYRAEAERLLLWTLIECRKPLSSLNREDLRAYEVFLGDPQPAQRWVNPAKPRRRLPDGTANPDWRPFAAGLAPANVERAIRIVDSLLSYLVQAGYLDGNPLALRRRASTKGSVGDRRKRRANPRRQALDTVEWAAVLLALEDLPRESTAEIATYERARFILMLFYHLGARISELASHAMGDLERTPEGWRWLVVGKGGREDWVPVNQALLQALLRYRQHLALAPYPAPQEHTPLLLTRNGERGITARQAYNIVKGLLRRGAERLEGDFPDKAANLRRASPHWLRHTMISRLADHLHEEPWVLQQLARHGRFDTTLLYVHVSDARRHAAAEALT